MAMERVGEILKMADRAHTAALAFNCMDYSMIHAVVTAAEVLNKPTIIMLYPDHAKRNRWCTAADFAQMVKREAARVKVPIGLHLDHCSDYDYILRAVRDGFESVMYDGSMLPFEENVRNTAAVVRAAHAMGAEVEAELGHVGVAANAADQSDEDLYTKPDVAARFCAESGCDAIAVAVGTAHGFYKETPKLDLRRLAEINAATDVPLVMHGGSGVPDDQLTEAFARGINKLNVGTELFHCYYQALREGCAADYSGFFDVPALAQRRMVDYLRGKMRLSKL